MHDGATKVGIIYLPEYDELFSATLDGPALANGQPIRVRPSAGLHEALVAVGYSRSRPREAFVEPMARLLEANCEVRRYGAGTFCLAMVGAGRIDGFWQQYLKPWDVLAGLLIVERAGGRVSDFLANDGLANGNVVLATSADVADELSRCLDIPLKPHA